LGGALILLGEYMALERLAPDVLLAKSTNLTGDISALQDDPDSPDANWLTASALQTAAAKDLWFLDSAAGAGYAIQDGGSGPTAANFHGTTNSHGWITQNAGPRYGYLDYNTQVPRASLLTTEPVAQLITTAGAGNFFRSPTAYDGEFAAGNWTIGMNLRGTTTADFMLKWHVFASVNATGAGARQLNSAAIATSLQTATLSTTATLLNATWNAPLITLANEYLFFVLYLHQSTAAGGTSQTIYLVKSGASKALTTIFTPREPGSLVRASLPTPVNPLTIGAGLQEYRARVRKKGTGTNPTAILKVMENASLITTVYNDALSSDSVISGTWNANLITNPANVEIQVEGVGAAGGSVEIGALEWNADVTIIQALTRTANSYIAAVTAGAGRTKAIQRAANTFIANVVAMSARNTTAFRLANSFVGAVTGIAHAAKSVGRTAGSFVSPIVSGVSRLGISKNRASVSYTESLTGCGNRLTDLVRVANSHIAAVTSIAHWFKEYIRSASSHIGVITANSVRNVQSVRFVQNYVQNLTGSSSRLAALHRMVISHVVGLSALGERTTIAFRKADAFVESLDGYSTSQIILYLIRSAASHIAGLTSSSGREGMDMDRDVLSGVADLQGHSGRVTTAIRQVQSFVQAISSLSSSSKGVMRSANSIIDSITSIARRVSSLWRQEDSSTGTVESKSSAVSSKIRTAASHISSISSKSNDSSIPKTSPGGMVIELVAKPHMAIATADSISFVAKTGDKNKMVVRTRAKTNMSVKVGSKPKMTIDLRTD
jgi:hypothetical protein